MREIPKEWIDQNGKVRIPREEYLLLVKYKERRKRFRKIIRGIVFALVTIAAFIGAMLVLSKNVIHTNDNHPAQEESNIDDEGKKEEDKVEKDNDKNKDDEPKETAQIEEDGLDIPIDEEEDEEEAVKEIEEEVELSTEIPEIPFGED